MLKLKVLKLSSLLILILMLLSFLQSRTLSYQTQDRAFGYYFISGSGSTKLNSTLNNVRVQRLLIDIAQTPQNKEYVDAKLKGTPTDTKALLNLGFIRRKEDLYVINFLLFSRNEERRMREITESHAQVLAASILNRRTEIEEVIKGYKLDGVDPRAVLYIILGCFSLDWDGLALNEEAGHWSRPSFFGRIFPQTVIYAWYPPDLSPELSRKGFYKGSHSTRYGKSTLLSFGDHEIQPRHAFPDILWTQDGYPDSLKMRVGKVMGTESEKAVGKQVVALMSALREGEMDLTGMAKVLDTSENRAGIFADFLVDLFYISENARKYSAHIPVLMSRDSLIVRRIRRIGREEMEHWLEFGYPQLRKELNELTPFHCGVDQSDLFYNIWHDIFGAANRILVEAGLFADPYSESYGAGGVIPAVFDNSLYEKP